MRSYVNSDNRKSIERKRGLILLSAILFLIFSGDLSGVSAEGWEYGRLRVAPKLSLVETYSDNIYLAPQDEADDFITEISPEIRVDFAFAPRNYLSLKYVGAFFYYDDADNFDSDHHLGEASWNVETAKGSTILLGASTSENSVQPFSETEISKDYNLKRAFADIFLLAGQVTAFGFGYERQARRFDEPQFTIDNYDRDQVDLSVVYTRSQVFPLLLQYRFVRQDSENVNDLDRDYDTHSVFTGARWRPTGKLSGALRVGYTWSDFKDQRIDEFSGFGMDIDLLYRWTEITHARITGRRAIRPTSFTERDTGTYYILTSGGLRLTHRRWERVETELRYTYNHRDFQSGSGAGIDRIDKEHIAGVSVSYLFRRWISFSLGYQYRKNNSDVPSVDYEENLAQAGVHISI